MPKEGDKSSKDNEDLDLSKNPLIIEMGKTMNGLATLLTQQQQATAKTNQGLEALVASIKAGDLSGGKHVKKEDEEIDPDAINDLDNAQLLPLIVGEISKIIDSRLGNLDNKIDSTDRGIEDEKVAAQVKALIGSNPDLFEWSGEIKAFSVENPGTKLTVKQIYTLVQEENPTKVAEMVEKYKEKEGEEEDKPGLLGLMPTSGVMSADDEKLTKEEAAEKAWEDTLENFPGLAQLGEG